MTETVPLREDGALEYLPVANIRPKAGFNPRTYFDEAQHRELVQSVKDDGVIQPIMVRPDLEAPGFYWIVVGERRWRAARDAHLDEIPAMVRDLSDAEAFVKAVKENVERAEMSPAEEAQAARKVLSGCEGDRTEATRLLGWSVAKFDARLLLLNATQEVLDALSARSIRLGHAELLSTLPPETQAGTLKRVIADQIPVSDLRERIAGFARELSSACFDTTDCQTCPNSSTMQAELFAESIGAGRCSNHVCFTDKTKAALRAKQAELQSEFAVVRLDYESEPGSYRQVCERGAEGVGVEQFSACQGCGTFGVVVCSQPGKEGTLLEDVCFNGTCHAEKVANNRSPSAPQSSDKPGAPTSKATTTAAKPTTKPKASAASTPRKVIEHIDSFYRNLAATVVMQDSKMTQVYAAVALLADGGFPEDIRARFQIKADRITGRDKLIAELYAKSEADLSDLISACAGHVAAKGTAGGDMVKAAQSTVAVLGVDVSEHFQMDAGFLQAHTKSGIEGLLKQLGFVRWYEGVNGDKSFQKFMQQKVEPLIKAIVSGGFNWKGKVPSCVSDRLRNTGSRPAARDSAGTTGTEQKAA